MSDQQNLNLKAIYHREDKNLRAVRIGNEWQSQRHDGSKATRERQPWYPIGPRRDEPPNWPR